MAPPAPERFMKIDARGSQKKPHRSNFAPQGVLWSPPGESWAPSRPQKSALGGKEEFENCMEGSWDHLGVLLARLGPILGRISRPLGGPGRLQEVIFGLFWDVPAEILKMSFCFLFFTYVGSFFLCYYLPSVVFLAPWLAASCICKKLKIHWFLWVARHMRLVLATPEAINFQWGRVINIGGKKSSKKDPRDQTTRSKKELF